MKRNDFVRQIEEYYGDYRPKVKEAVIGYIFHFTEMELNQLWTKTIREYSGQYKIPPDVAIFEKLRRDIDNDKKWDKSKALPDMTRNPENQEKVARLFRGLRNKFKF